MNLKYFICCWEIVPPFGIIMNHMPHWLMPMAPYEKYDGPNLCSCNIGPINES